MKIIYLKILVLASILSVHNTAFSQVENIENRRYNIESAIIKYKLSGKTKGTETLKFDDWGKREIYKIKTVRQIVFYSVKNIQKINTLNISKADTLYSIDLNNKTGVKTIFSNITNPNQFSKADILNNNGKLLFKDTILGKNCEVWKTEKLKIWLWQGVALKIESKIIAKHYIKEAIEIQTGVTIDSQEFTVPIDVKLLDYTKK